MVISKSWLILPALSFFMTKLVIILYLSCFAIYILFSRQPDFFDSDTTKATIHFLQDSLSKKQEPFAQFAVNRMLYQIPAGYNFRNLHEGETVNIIYENEKPSHAAVYTFWGYWITAGELFFSIGLIIVMYYIATAITANPSPEAVIEQLEEKPYTKRKKYND